MVMTTMVHVSMMHPHDVLRKVVAYYKIKHKNVKNEFLVVIWNCYHIYK
jgi:hypothetical protein